MTRQPFRQALIALALPALLLAATPAASQDDMPTHLVQISLLAAAKTGPDELADLPENTRAAIDDVRRFLPFKSYRLLDTALLRAQRAGQTTLTGPEDREFRVSFNLDGRQEPGKLLVRSFDLVEKFMPAAPLLSADSDRGAPVVPASKLVMSSSFSADVGQTVVVGTSRLNGGDEAMIVLFTALP